MADDVSRDDLNADRLEEDWEHALDAADEALAASSRAGSLGASDVAAIADRIRNERRWFHRFRPALHRLFPRRR
jgi:hypothetical protein